MAEPNKQRRKRERDKRRGQQQAASLIHDNREALSVNRRAMYEQGTFAPERPNRNGPQPLTATEVAAIKEQIRAGRTPEHVAHDLGVHLPSVIRVLKVLKLEAEERDVDQVHPESARRADLLAAHDAGVCGGDCRLGRHGFRR